jgi:hypothetical protein
MTITNKFNLPESFINVLERKQYTRGKAHYSATDYTNPIQIVLLKQRYDNEIEQDASEMLWALLGSATHYILNEGEPRNAIVEERLYTEIEGRVLSGQSDLYHEDGTISDYKVTSAWTSVYGSRITIWTQQLNIYAYLYRVHGFIVNRLEVVAIYRDWTLNQAQRSQDYPQQQVEVIKVDLWDLDKQEKFLADKTREFKKYENVDDAKLPQCTSEDMWEQPAQYAIMKEGRKSAVRVFDTESEAINFLINNADTKPQHIEFRPGKRTRCENYCVVNKFCKQFQEWQKTK